MLTLFLLSSCSLLIYGPTEKSSEERLKSFKRIYQKADKNITISFDKHMIPYIEGATEEETAFGVGLVQAHLRLGQMELFKYISQGRLSELAGPFVVKIDQALRTIGFGRSAKKMIEGMDPTTKKWVSSYLSGVNFYIEHTEDVPPDLKSLGIEPRSWTMVELMTLWRLLSTDVNWLVYFGLLMEEDPKVANILWKRFKESSSMGMMSSENPLHPSHLPWYFSKSGSNSLVLGKKKTGTGASLISNDPHLGLFLPNFWIIMGMKSPTVDVVGLSIPGLPFVALGRNKHLTWGGTNMWGMSTFLYEVDENEPLKEEKHHIKVRSWFDEEYTVRLSKLGPVISDLSLIKSKKKIAFHWVGHQASDEATTFYKMNRAKSIDEFRAAYETYAVSAQNFLVGDDKGNIGHVLAMRFPQRKDMTNFKLINGTDNPIVRYQNPTRLPFGSNPKEGFIASANNRPIGHPQVGMFFSGNDRINRLKNLARSKEIIEITDLQKWHEDIYSDAAFKLSRLILEVLGSVDDEKLSRIKKELSLWNGNYDKDKKAPLMLEKLSKKLAMIFYKDKLSMTDENVASLFRDRLWRERLIQDYEKKESYRQELLGYIEEESFEESWGEVHFVRATHPLGSIPYLGGKWRLLEYPVSGGGTTLFKTASQKTTEKHYVSYGANARHISDMSDPRKNFFVLYGGQDGWMTTDNTIDQIELWRKNQMVQIPLGAKEFRKQAKWVLEQ